MKQKLVLPFEIKEVTAEGKFSGLASVYGQVDLGGDVVERGAFTKSLGENPEVPVLWQHKADEVIGSGTLRNTREGLAIDAQLDMEDPLAQKAHGKLMKKLLKGLSIGFNSIPDKTLIKNGVRHLQEVKLWEVSIVTFPANLGAMVTSVKALMDRKDFNSELDAAQTWAKRYQMISALDMALYDIIWDNGSAEEKIAAAEESIAQFSQAFLDFLPDLLALMESRYKSAVETFEKKEGRQITDRKALIETASTNFQALLVKAASGTLRDPAAANEPEPGDSHSEAHFLKGLDGLKALIPAA